MLTRVNISAIRDRLIENRREEEDSTLLDIENYLNSFASSDFLELYGQLYKDSQKGLSSSCVQVDFFIKQHLGKAATITPEEILSTKFKNFKELGIWDLIPCNDSICFVNIGNEKDEDTESNYHLTNLNTFINILAANNIRLQISKPTETGKIPATAIVNLNTIEQARKERNIDRYVLSSKCPVDALREYVDNCVKNQAGCKEEDIPEEHRIPKNIVFSNESIRYFFEDSICDFVGASAAGKSIGFYWEKSQEYPALEVRVILNPLTGEYELEYLKESASDNKEEFVWDRSTSSGKAGIIKVYTPTDPLDEITDMGKCKKIG